MDYNNSIKYVCVYIFFALFLMMALVFFPYNKNPIQFSCYKIITLAIIIYAFYSLSNASYKLTQNNESEIMNSEDIKKTLIYNFGLGLAMLMIILIFARY